VNLFTLLARSAARFPEHGAIYSGAKRVLSYAELHQRALRLAATLQAQYPPGARLVLASKNCPEMLTAMFGAWAAGMVVTPLNAKLHPLEMAEIVEDADPSIIFASAGLASELHGRVSGDTPLMTLVPDRIDELLAPHPAAQLDLAPDDLAWLFYTSGTTGRSKGAMLTHRNLMAMTISHLADFEDIGEDDSIIHAAPISHGSGLYVLPYIARGARHVIPASAGFEPDEFLDLCDVHPGCGAFLAPTMVQRLRLAVEKCHRPVPSGLRSIVYGGGPMYLDEIRQSLACFGPIFRQLYGQGESPMTITGLRQRDFDDRSDACLGSVGWPRSGVEVKIAGPDGQPLSIGEVGEILCRGDIVMEGYWRNPAATAETLNNGWLRTGDVGLQDATGRITLRDRSKEVIISGGTNIYPREVEEILLEHPAVVEVAVIGRPDAEWGETVTAVVVTAVVVTGADRLATAAALDRLCLARIARFKRPKHYAFLPELPKSPYGKILKREIRSAVIDGRLELFENERA
jgi:acyl-CoA synthetase (AMP-forming)/AMP-acid ligase II